MTLSHVRSFHAEGEEQHADEEPQLVPAYAAIALKCLRVSSCAMFHDVFCYMLYAEHESQALFL